RVHVRDLSKYSIKKYYEVPFNGEYSYKSEQDALDCLDKLFDQAIRRQLMSDVPLGFFLSGGLDSSLIVAKAREITGKRLSCYTIKANDNDWKKEGVTNDLHYAKKVADYLDVNLHIVETDVNILEDFDKMIWHLDEPQGDVAPLNVLSIAQLAKDRGESVLLGGVAGDDLFSGYRRHQALAYDSKLRRMGISSLFKNQYRDRIIQGMPIKSHLKRKLIKLFGQIDTPSSHNGVGYYQWVSLQESLKLFRGEIQEQIEGYEPSQILLASLDEIPDEPDRLNKMLYWDIKYFLTDHNLNYTDKMSMAVGVEARVPFLDYDLVKFSTDIDPKLKMKGSTTKYLLKKLAERYLPQDVVYRPKTGFGAPVRKWIMEDMNELIYNYLSPDSIKSRGIFNEATVWELIEENKRGERDRSYTVLSLLAIESWFRQFVDQK
ncbi:MAG: asparagine synthase C-terminal domain-containing protein, partial [Bacteroidota bacterium]